MGGLEPNSRERVRASQLAGVRVSGVHTRAPSEHPRGVRIGVPGFASQNDGLILPLTTAAVVLPTADGRFRPGTAALRREAVPGFQAEP